MLYVYIGCLTFGAIYSVLSLILGGHHGFDHGGADHGGADHGDLPSPFNPLVIASAITAFGAVGLIGKIGFKLGDLMSSVVALGFAGVIGAIIFFGIVKLMYDSQSDSTFSQNDLIGAEAEVLTPIPVTGMGEVVCSINGVRYTLAAKTIYGEEIGRGECVRIKEIAGNIALVTKKVTIEDLDELEIVDTENTEINKKERNENTKL